jgi:hypothetical protein
VRWAIHLNFEIHKQTCDKMFGTIHSHVLTWQLRFQASVCVRNQGWSVHPTTPVPKLQPYHGTTQLKHHYIILIFFNMCSLNTHKKRRSQHALLGTRIPGPPSIPHHPLQHSNCTSISPATSFLCTRRYLPDAFYNHGTPVYTADHPFENSSTPNTVENH